MNFALLPADKKSSPVSMKRTGSRGTTFIDRLNGPLWLQPAFRLQIPVTRDGRQSLILK